MLKRLVIVLVAACMVNGGCTIAKKSQQLSDNAPKVTGPVTYIYKTRSNYNLNVPVILSTDKKTIVSYPDIKDVYTNGKLAIPTLLNDGFLLDNRGISVNVAFLKISYQQYAALSATPHPDSLFNMILDNDPLTVLYDCGRRTGYQHLNDDLNNIINKKNFSKFKKLK